MARRSPTTRSLRTGAAEHCRWSSSRHTSTRAPHRAREDSPMSPADPPWGTCLRARATSSSVLWPRTRRREREHSSRGAQRPDLSSDGSIGRRGRRRSSIHARSRSRQTSRAVSCRPDGRLVPEPPGANLELLAALAPHLHAAALVTDVGSVKRGIVARAEALGLATRFAGSHPLAGTHRRGFEASRADLFTGAMVYVTPAAGGEGAAREVAHFWESVGGAHAVVVDAA